MSDIIKKYLINGQVNVTVANTTELVREMQRLHHTSHVASAALGRTLTAAAIMGAGFRKSEHRLSLTINGGGPIGTITAAANAMAEVKGFVTNPDVFVPINEANGKLNVGAAVGNDGFITVVKDIGLKDYYVGKTELISGEIAEDFANYYLKSEQTPSIVYLGVLVGKDGNIEKAGGMVVTPMQDADDALLAEVEMCAPLITEFTSMLDTMPLDEILNIIFVGLHVEAMPGSECEPKYVCDCSRERFERGIISLGKKEINDIIEEDGEAEIVCQFCNKAYHFNKEELQALLAEAEGKK
ncbi:MAG: Hsp33 family molecular chaperone HslO [Clostridiales bacterium]|nr:Hsp33 family molecular chaperone HslO [Clostridiales bacterium]MBP3941091.1 Hsp33 family molecular chaperone HslO [Christensenellaceae bacterium]